MRFGYAPQLRASDTRYRYALREAPFCAFRDRSQRRGSVECLWNKYALNGGNYRQSWERNLGCVFRGLRGKLEGRGLRGRRASLLTAWAFSGTDRGLLRSGLGLWSPPSKHEAPGHSEASASKIFRHPGMTVAFKTAFYVFTRVGPDNSLERLTEGSAGLVTDRPSDVDELVVALL